MPATVRTPAALTPDATHLVADHAHLVSNLISRLQIPAVPPHVEDRIYAAGLDGLCLAAARSDRSGDVPFATRAHPFVARAVVAAISSARFALVWPQMFPDWV